MLEEKRLAEQERRRNELRMEELRSQELRNQNLRNQNLRNEELRRNEQQREEPVAKIRRIVSEDAHEGKTNFSLLFVYSVASILLCVHFAITLIGFRCWVDLFTAYMEH